MPWRERSPVDLRVQFISEDQTGLWSMTELTEHYGISRKTATSGSNDRSRRRCRVAGSVAAAADAADGDRPALVAALLAVRRRHPRWGAKKLLAMVRRQDPARPGRVARPCVICCAARAGSCRVRADARCRTAGMPCARSPVRTTTWTTDFKGEFRTGDRPLLLSADPPRRLQSVRAPL